MTSKTEQKPDFEKALGELETLVSKLETGELSLDQSLDCFKRGVELTRLCQTVLNEAQQTVQTLSQEPAEKTDNLEDSA
jgi:exodeoxyribonuclease VII small subunit